MSSLTVSGDMKYLLFIFLGIMLTVLVLGYHKSPVASKNLGAQQMAATQVSPSNLQAQKIIQMASISEPYEQDLY